MISEIMVSVIIPVYNAEYCISKCLDSILINKSIGFEVILIDDGSIDNSLDICKEYAKIDKRVRVYKKENGGASSARNRGLEYASGIWITFVDADDIILIKDWTFLFESKSDLVMLPHCTRYKYLYEQHGFADNINIDNYHKYLNSPCFKTACSKFYRKSLLKEVSFDERMKVGEDQLFLLEYFRAVRSFEVINLPFYEYQLPDISAGRKYHLSIDNSVFAMHSIYNAYLKLNKRNCAFEEDLFKSFKFLCQEQIDKTPMKWYNNIQVKYLYEQMCDSLSFTYRLKYYLLSNPLLSKIRNILK